MVRAKHSVTPAGDGDILASIGRRLAAASRHATMAAQPVTVNVADATLPLWRPLAWKVSFRPG